MLTVDQRTELDTRGLTYVRGVVPRDEAAAIEARFWTFLGRRGIDQHDRSTWPDGWVGKLQGLRQAKVFAPFDNGTLAAVLDELLGAGSWGEPWGSGQALLSFPQPGPWDVPHRMWHFDLPAKGPTDHLEVARLLGFVNHVEPRGGGTLVVEGSHELVRRMVERSASRSAGKSNDVRKRLAARHPWFRALVTEGGADRVQQFMVDGDEIDGVRVRVAEVTGEPGDLAVMHPWMLHDMSMNCGARPRMMMTHTIFRTGSVFLGAPHRA